MASDTPAPYGGDTTASLDWIQVSAGLAALGVPTPARAVLDQTTPLADAVEASGLPAYLKGHTPQAPHKSERGLVRGPLTSLAEVEHECNEMRSRLHHDDLFDAELTLEGAADTRFEWFLAYTWHAVLGSFLHLGAGGVFLELVDDTVTIRTPVTPCQWRRSRDELRHGRVLNGFRNLVPPHSESILAVVRRLTQARLDRTFGGRVLRLELNPLCVLPSGDLIAVDGRARME